MSKWNALEQNWPITAWSASPQPTSPSPCRQRPCGSHLGTGSAPDPPRLRPDRLAATVSASARHAPQPIVVRALHHPPSRIVQHNPGGSNSLLTDGAAMNHRSVPTSSQPPRSKVRFQVACRTTSESDPGRTAAPPFQQDFNFEHSRPGVAFTLLTVSLQANSAHLAPESSEAPNLPSPSCIYLG